MEGLKGENTERQINSKVNLVFPDKKLSIVGFELDSESEFSTNVLIPSTELVNTSLPRM